MKKKLLMYALTFAAAFMFSLSTANAWTVSLEADGEAEVEVGDTFTVSLYFNADEGGNELSLYGLAIGYDTDELDWNSSTASSQHTPPSGIFKMYGEATEVEDGLIDYWYAQGWASGATVSGSVLLATIEFTVLDANWDGDLDVWFVDKEGIFCRGSMAIDGVAYDIFSDSSLYTQGPDVGSAVPVPGAGLLLGAGLLSLVGIGRRKTRD